MEVRPVVQQSATERGQNAERGQNKATARILTVLSAFVSDALGFGVTELSQQLGMTKNMVHRALTTLVDQGYLVRDAAGARYELGYRVAELQNPNLPEPDFRTLCATAIQQFYDLTGETATLTIRAGDNVVFIEGIETRKPGVWRLPIGSTRPLHNAASSRAVLAFLPDSEIEDYIKRNAPLDLAPSIGTISADDLWREIRTIRQQGYAIAHRNTPPRQVSLAFPIWDADGRVHGSLAVGGPEERFADKPAQLVPQLEKIMVDLNRLTRLMFRA
jgi:DNA-binding IclR family transcriptional regulator